MGDLYRGKVLRKAAIAAARRFGSGAI
jgi:hypothetical protein